MVRTEDWLKSSKICWLTAKQSAAGAKVGVETPPKVHPLDNAPRPNQPKADLGLVVMMMIIRMMMMKVSSVLHRYFQTLVHNSTQLHIKLIIYDIQMEPGSTRGFPPLPSRVYHKNSATLGSFPRHLFIIKLEVLGCSAPGLQGEPFLFSLCGFGRASSSL